MNPQQAVHYKMLAQAHEHTPGDLAAAYREIGRLIDENEQLLIAIDAWVELEPGTSDALLVDTVCDELNAIYKRFKDVS